MIEEPGFRQIGSLLPPTSNSPSPADTSQTSSPHRSATTGTPKPDETLASSTGQELGEIGSAANRSPTATIAKAPPTTSLKARPERQRHTNVALQISKLMNHFWKENETADARQAQIEDWIEDLVEFPADVVETACREWRQHNNRRPVPADIRSTCKQIIQIRRESEHLRLEYQRYPGCNQRFERCADRWHQVGFICRESCREKIPGYYAKE